MLIPYHGDIFFLLHYVCGVKTIFILIDKFVYYEPTDDGMSLIYVETYEEKLCLDFLATFL